VRNADLILVLKQGEIVERGSFSELMTKRGVFAELYKTQFLDSPAQAKTA